MNFDAETVSRLMQEVDAHCNEKVALGEEKYGPGTWLSVDNIEHALDEVIDLINYAKFTYIRLRLLQLGVHRLSVTGMTAEALPGQELIGKESLIQPFKQRQE